MLSTILKHPISIKNTLLTDVRFICEITQKYLKQDKNVSPMVVIVRTFLTRSSRLSNGLSQSARFFKPREMSQNLLIRHQQTKKLDVNTNVKNNVIIYKNENQKYTQIMGLLAIVHIFGWSLLAVYTYTPSLLDIFLTDIKFKKYMEQNMFRFSFFIFSILIGPLGYATMSIVCHRTIRYIVLHKGGKTVTFTTSNLWNNEYNMQVPVGMVKCICQRTSNIRVLPIKLKDKRFHYLIEKKGTFLNPELFDHTIGFANFRNS